MNDNEQKFSSMAHKRRVERLQNDSIKVGDKVQWVGFRGDTEIVLKGIVESIGEFNNVKNFTVRKFGTFPEDRTQTQISASRVTKTGEV